jgi:hypothetical protein
MNDDRAKLSELLQQLQAQLSASSTLEAATRRRLEHALDEAQHVLAAPPAAGPGSSGSPEPLGKRLEDVALEFETSHPALAGTVSSIIDALGRMGI